MKPYFTKFDKKAGKMMLYSRDLKIGDKFIHPAWIGLVVKEGIDIVADEEDLDYLLEQGCYKEVAATDETADWIEEGMEFEEDDIEGFMWAGNADQLGYIVITEEYMKTINELIGKTFYCTSKYNKNLTFKITHSYHFPDYVSVDTWEGMSSKNRPMGRIKAAHYSVASINEMLETGILSETKIK